MVKLQEELKSAHNAAKIAHADLEQQKERSTNREQEAFAARYQLVGVQEELALTQEKIKLVEQERDVLRTIAKNEEIARIAAEGHLPLPISPEDDEFASPKKARKSLDPVTILSSAASEEELDNLRIKLEWEERRASRALDQVDFLEAECRLNVCASRTSRTTESQRPNAVDEPMRCSSTVLRPSEDLSQAISRAPEESPWISPAKKLFTAPMFLEHIFPERSFARTPSCDPPAPAVVSDPNTSLLSLLDAPHSSISPTPSDEGDTAIVQTFHTISTTTRIPLADPPDLIPKTTLPVDLAHPALSPTMSREEALAQIHERRGRARSIAQGNLTPRKQMVEGGLRRDISAPAIRSVNVRGRSQARI